MQGNVAHATTPKSNFSEVIYKIAGSQDINSRQVILQSQAKMYISEKNGYSKEYQQLE